MSELIQLGALGLQPAFARPSRPSAIVLWLQSVTLAWMLVELSVSAFAAVTARSPAMMTFGSDSLVELLSAAVVLLQWIPKQRVSETKARRASAVLLFMLAFMVGLIALGALVFRLQPETSRAGMGITIAALIAMPILRSFSQAPRGSLQQECSLGRRCRAIRNLRLHCAHHVGRPRGKRRLPCPVVRFGCRFEVAHPNSHQRRQIRLARAVADAAEIASIRVDAHWNMPASVFVSACSRADSLEGVPRRSSKGR